MYTGDQCGAEYQRPGLSANTDVRCSLGRTCTTACDPNVEENTDHLQVVQRLLVLHLLLDLRPLALPRLHHPLLVQHASVALTALCLQQNIA